jgi:hypothetical protein
VLSHLVRSEIIRRSARSTYLHTGRPPAPFRHPGIQMFARNLSDKGDMRPGPAHFVGPHLARGPARLLPALDRRQDTHNKETTEHTADTANTEDTAETEVPEQTKKQNTQKTQKTQTHFLRKCNRTRRKHRKRKPIPSANARDTPSEEKAERKKEVSNTVAKKANQGNLTSQYKVCFSIKPEGKNVRHRR